MASTYQLMQENVKVTTINFFILVCDLTCLTCKTKAY